jgi:putative transposase
MSDSIEAKLVCAALRPAYWQRKPDVGLLVHTDRGSQYASHDYREMATDYGITMSMSRKGNCWDTQSTMAPSAASCLTRAGIGVMPLR